jgi:hypothetical protein
MEASPVPNHGVERRKEAQSVVDLVPRSRRVLALRPKPQQAVHLGMSIARFGVLLELPHFDGRLEALERAPTGGSSKR